MLIYIVQPGDTIHKIAERYGLSAERLIQDNELTNPDKLIVGQTIIILFPKKTYTVKHGDTLESIAGANGVSQIQILRNNPKLAEGDFLYQGESIVIEYSVDKTRTITMNGYAYRHIDSKTLRKTLPYLTYLTIFSYTITAQGDLIPVDDTELIKIAKEYGVAPLMLITTFTGLDKDNVDLTHAILNDQQSQNRLIENILCYMKLKGYYGLNIDTNYIYTEDLNLYADFISNITKQLNMEGFKVVLTFTPQALEGFPETICEESKYGAISREVNDIFLLQYGWGHTFGSSMSIAPINRIRKYVAYMPTNKMAIGIPSISYDWEIPNDSDSTPKSQYLSYHAAIDLAVEVNAMIQYDNTTQTPYYQYTINHCGMSTKHIVWFRDARSIESMVKLIPEYDLKGIGIWNIMQYFPLLWLVINNTFDIDHVL